MMDQARFRIALSNIISEIDRRCSDITHPVPDTPEAALEQLRPLLTIISDSTEAVLNIALMRGDERDLEKVLTKIRQIRLTEYEHEDKKATEQRAKA